MNKSSGSAAGGLSRRGLTTGLACMGSTMILPTIPAVAQGAPSGTVEITQVQMAFIVSGNIGSGRLGFQGRTYAFTIGGLGAGGYGVSRVEAYGEIYNLSRIEQFPGLYFSGRYGAAVGQAGGGELFLQNKSGVNMRLRARRTGLALSLGADGIEIRLK